LRITRICACFWCSWFSHAILLAQEEERSRLSRELHDTVAQDLRCLSMGMDKIGNCTDAKEREKLCTAAAASHSALIRKVHIVLHSSRS